MIIKKSQVAQKILDYYEENIFFLPQKNIGHFFERAYRMTGNKKYIKVLAQYFFIKKTSILSQELSTLKDHVKNQTKFKLPKTFYQKNQRQIDRFEMYKKNPAISFFDTLLLNMFFIKSVHLYSSYYKNICNEIMLLLKNIDFEKIYANKDVILKVGSFAINSVFFLDQLGLDKKNLKTRTVLLIKRHYLSDDLVLKISLNKWEYHTFIYNLTHVIIAASHFYEKNVEDYLWITKYFNNNIDNIIKNTTQDILAEVGLCLKLTKEEEKYEESLKKIKLHILNNYKPKDMLSQKNLITKEHTNSIIMLLFYDNASWHPGPDLSHEKDIFKNLILP